MSQEWVQISPLKVRLYAKEYLRTKYLNLYVNYIYYVLCVDLDLFHIELQLCAIFSLILRRFDRFSFS